MKHRRHRLVLDVTFREALTEKEAQSKIAQLADDLIGVQRAVVKEFSRVLRAEQRKALLGSQRRLAR